MNWTAFEHDKLFITEALKNGDFDYVEVLGAVEETRFFKMLLGEGVLNALAQSYPTPRKKEEVPLWLYLASELTLRLHGAMGFGAYPYILHCGGLLDAIRNKQVENKQDPDSGDWRPSCKGYNQKNHYARSTPCDKDFLRKMPRIPTHKHSSVGSAPLSSNSISSSMPFMMKESFWPTALIFSSPWTIRTMRAPPSSASMKTTIPSTRKPTKSCPGSARRSVCGVAAIVPCPSPTPNRRALTPCAAA